MRTVDDPVTARPFEVVIIEDHQLLAQALEMWMVKRLSCAVTGLAEDGEKGLELCLQKRPDLVLIDIELPKLDGLQLVPLLKKKLPKTRLLMVSGRKDPFTIWRVLQSGVDGFVDKTSGYEELRRAIQEVLQGRRYYSPLLLAIKEKWLAQSEAFHKILTNREQEVLARVAAGWNDETISKGIGISPATVIVHRRNIRRKLDLHNDRDLVGYAQRWGLITKPPTP